MLSFIVVAAFLVCAYVRVPPNGKSVQDPPLTTPEVKLFRSPGSPSTLDSTLFYDNDICLMFMGTQLTLGTGVATIILPVQGAVVPDGASAFITGWGVLSEGGSSPTSLYKVTIPIINQQLCVNAYSGLYTVTTNMICAGRLGVGGQDACRGDGGGPLVVGGLLIGISSWVKECAHPSYPGVSTRVPSFRNWINSNL